MVSSPRRLKAVRRRIAPSVVASNGTNILWSRSTCIPYASTKNLNGEEFPALLPEESPHPPDRVFAGRERR